MKNKFKYIVLSLFTISVLFSCIDDDNDELTGDAITGGLVNVSNPLISYVVGSGATYSATGSVYQGEVQTTTIDIYNVFTDNFSGIQSNKVLLKSITIDNTDIGQKPGFNFTFTYAELIAGLTLEGSPLPANDGGLNIGDFWTLSYTSTTSNGNQTTNGKVTKVAVGTRYAGIYTVIESAYWNSGGFNGGWSGTDRIIESVDATTYRHVGLAFWDDNEFYFTVDNATGYITVLDVDLAGDDLLLNGSPVMTCEGAGGAFESITCDNTTSVAIPDDVNGEDELKFTVGYFRGVGATREFFEHLVKKVD